MGTLRPRNLSKKDLQIHKEHIVSIPRNLDNRTKVVKIKFPREYEIRIMSFSSIISHFVFNIIYKSNQILLSSSIGLKLPFVIFRNLEILQFDRAILMKYRLQLIWKFQIMLNTHIFLSVYAVSKIFCL